MLPIRTVIRSLARVAALLAAAMLAFGALAPVAAAATSLTVTTPYPSVAVAPGSKVSFDLTIHSSVPAQVGLTVDGVPTGWSATLRGGGFVVDGVTAAPAKDATARLDVTVPADAAAATQTLRVTASGGGATAALPISIRVNQSAAGDITMTTTTPTLTGTSDATFTFNLTVRNDTAQDITVSATATGQPGWTVKAAITGQTQAASTVVPAGSTTGIQVTATPQSGTVAGTYPINVVAQAGDKSIPADLGIQITGSFSVSLSTPNQLLSASGAAGSPTSQQFVITNTGTAPLTNVALTATPPTNWKVTYAPTTLASIPPGQTGEITATITPSGEAVAGDYVVSFKAANDQANANASADIRFTVETSPVWAIVGVGVILAIVIGLFVVFRTYGRR